MRPEAEQIAAAICQLRPDWLQSSLVTLMGRQQHRAARDVALALVWLAYDPETKTPGRLETAGPHWLLSRMAGASDTTGLPYYDRAPVVAEPHPSSPESIRQIRQAARAATTEGKQQ